MSILPIAIDIVLVAVFIGAILDGRRKGFVKMILSIIATAMGVVIAWEYSGPVSVWIEENLVRDAAINKITEVFSTHVGGTVQEIIDALPAYIKTASEFDGFDLNALLPAVMSQDAVQSATETLYATVQDYAIIPAARIVSFFVILAICSAVLGIGISVIDRFFKLPVLRGLNKTLGAVLGGIKGVFEMYVISGIIGFAALLIPVAEFSEAVSNATLQQGLWETIVSFLK